MRPALQALGVEMVTVVIASLEKARLYFKHRPVPGLVAVDPEAATHRKYGVPTAERLHAVTLEQFMTVMVNPMGEFPAALPVAEASAELNRRDDYRPLPEDAALHRALGSQLVGCFLLDRAGVVRWTHVESMNGPQGHGSIPAEQEFAAAASRLAEESSTA
jgi:hypothetical protein